MTETLPSDLQVIPDTYPPVLQPAQSWHYKDGTQVYRLAPLQIRRDADELIGDQVWQVRLIGVMCPNKQCRHFTTGAWLRPGVNYWRYPLCPACLAHQKYYTVRASGLYRLSLQPSEKEVGYVVQCKCLLATGPDLQHLKTSFRTVVRKPHRVHLPCSICRAAPEVKEVVSQVPRWVVPGTEAGPYAPIVLS